MKKFNHHKLEKSIVLDSSIFSITFLGKLQETKVFQTANFLHFFQYISLFITKCDLSSRGDKRLLIAKNNLANKASASQHLLCVTIFCVAPIQQHRKYSLDKPTYQLLASYFCNPYTISKIHVSNLKVFVFHVKNIDFKKILLL